MRIIWILFLTVVYPPLIGAQEIDWSQYVHLLQVNSTDPQELSSLITSDFETDVQKVEAIFYWITHNIAYDYKLAQKRKKEEKKRNSKKYTKEQIKEKEKKDLITTLKKKKGICHEYSLLFSTLCKASNIACQRIEGWSKTNPLKISSMGEKHAWNLVYVGGSWEMVDATYGSGYLDEEENFVFDFNDNYYMTDKQIFSLNHFPITKSAELPGALINKELYKNYPIIGDGYIECKVKNLDQQNKSIKVKRGSLLEINCEIENAPKQVFCYKPSKEEMIPCDFSITDNKLQIALDTEDLRSGMYLFLAGQKLLFSYKISVQ